MDLGPGPPQQSPDDYSAREKRERTGVAVGITIGVLVLFAGPLCLLWFANWRRKRRLKKQEFRDLEGTTAISHDEKYGTSSFERTGATTLTTTLAAGEEPTEAEIAQWRELRSDHTVTDLERLKADPTSPLNRIPKAIEQPTPEELLGLNKTSYLQSLPIASSPQSTPDDLPGITVLPSQLPPVEIGVQGDSSKQSEGTPDVSKCISPWAVEHEPNPVIFKHLLGPRGERLGHGEAATQANVLNDQNDAPPEHTMALDVIPRWNEGVHHSAQKESPVQDEERSRDSSALEDTSSASPSSSTSSQDSSHPLLSDGSTKGLSQSPTSFKLPDLHQEQVTASGSGSQTTETSGSRSCTHCNHTFTTTGQLNAHIHRKHVRRYSCAICPSTFHLKTDLKRHEFTVHRKDLAAETSGFRCSNQGCSIPDKVFLRRDNFERHVARCTRRKEVEKGHKTSE